MDLNQLQIFAKTVEIKSFTGAAKALGLTKTTVSRKISELEERVGIKLLTRSTRRIALTHDGVLFYETIYKAFSELKTAESQLITDIDKGKIKVVLPYELNDVVDYSIFYSYLEAQKNINIELELCNKSKYNLINENIDILFHFNEINDNTIKSIKLLNINKLMVASPSYISKHGAPTYPTEINTHNYIDCMSNQSVDIEQGKIKLFDGKSWVYLTPNIKMSLDSAILAKNLAIDGFGITVLPEELAEVEIAKGTLINILEDYPIKSSILYLSYIKQHPIPSRITSFINHIHTNLISKFSDRVIDPVLDSSHHFK
ncbi:LysR family transcriptional regulator [Shewanella dokdonensis]|uniref:LysR family transcriptional regulator n=1 Tax=Shewanella dokdonensis TaxID=712036 RepID=A0ABX8DFF3_9GAMM|nr:LysR family transcriptional regulator [Shewanella dokdonensis]MCL1073184.1 LysR family transcriptional regulator [Shewanella dokdonensis]QVK22956.1 LysR family transcriptional regulator [Shewanella dokdonensis]